MKSIAMFLLILAMVLIPVMSLAEEGAVSSHGVATAVTPASSGPVWIGHVQLAAANTPCLEEAAPTNPVLGDQKATTATPAVSSESATAQRTGALEKAAGKHCSVTLKTWIGHTDFPSWTCS